MSFATAPNPPRPNIVVFLVDDMGWQDTSVSFWSQPTEFNRRYRTPNMERLAKKGMVFTNGYTFPVCTPSRVSLITGTNPARHRITHWTSPNPNTNTDYPDSSFQSVPWNIQGMSPIAGIPTTFNATPLPALLKKAGYFTVLSGKAHFGSSETPGGDPINLGFDVNIAGSSIGHPASYYGRDNYDNPVKGKPNRNAVPGLEKYHGTDTFLSDAITIEALEAISKPILENRPFFLYLSHYAVHTPIQADPRFVNRYLEMGLDQKEANYASLVEGMDKSLGDLIDYLDAKNITDNTLIIFLSDNGGLSLHPQRGGVEHTHNLPLRAGKGSVYEGGIRVPMIASWPSKIKAGSRTDQPVIVEDLFPTLLEVAGVRKTNTIQEVDGISFVNLLTGTGKSNPNRELLWHHPHRWVPKNGPAINWASAYRKGNWKLVYDYSSETLELYDLATDISEKKNLATDKPQITRQLAKNFTRMLKNSGAQMPLRKATGKPVPWPDEIAQ